VIGYPAPLDNNHEVVRFGAGAVAPPNRKNAVEAAIKTGRIAATAPIRLVQEKAEQAGILLIFPVLDGPLGPGVLLVVHRMGTFVDGLLAQFHSLVGIRLTDLDADKVLYGRPFFRRRRCPLRRRVQFRRP
jgi:hypothetical protein